MWTQQTTDKIEDVLQLLLEKHAEFLKATRKGTTDAFCEQISTELTCSMADSIRNLLKNLGKDFRALQMENGRTGMETQED